MATITKIEGIAATNAKKLEKAGITTVEGLLSECGSRKGRKAVAEATGLDEKKLLEWANRADLFRIKGVSSQYSDLLEASGVDTVKELAKRKADNLHAKMVEVNNAGKKRLVGQTPGLARVEDWIRQAGQLDPKITH